MKIELEVVMIDVNIENPQHDTGEQLLCVGYYGDYVICTYRKLDEDLYEFESVNRGTSMDIVSWGILKKKHIINEPK